MRERFTVIGFQPPEIHNLVVLCNSNCDEEANFGLIVGTVERGQGSERTVEVKGIGHGL